MRRFQILVGYLVVIGIIAAVVAIILYVQRPPGRYAEKIKEGVLYKVVKVLDGDTLVANVSGYEVTLRLIGMDTPEVVDPRKPVQCYGTEASAKAKEILSNKNIYIEREKNREAYDKYGRVLAYARLSNGDLYNEFMIKNGFAREYTFNNQKYLYQKEFKAAQATAKKSKLGLWQACPN